MFFTYRLFPYHQPLSSIFHIVCGIGLAMFELTNCGWIWNGNDSKFSSILSIPLIRNSLNFSHWLKKTQSCRRVLNTQHEKLSNCEWVDWGSCTGLLYKMLLTFYRPVRSDETFSQKSYGVQCFFCYLLGASQGFSVDNWQGNQQESGELYALQWFQVQILGKSNKHKKNINNYLQHILATLDCNALLTKTNSSLQGFFFSFCKYLKYIFLLVYL